MGTVISLALAGALWAQDDGWARVKQLAPGADIKVEVDETLSFRGRFSAADEQSMTFVVGGRDHTVERGRIRRISIRRGTSHRGRNILLGYLVGSAAGGLLYAAGCAGKSAGCMEGSPVVAVPAGAVGLILGATLPANGWQEIYRSGGLGEAGKSSR